MNETTNRAALNLDRAMRAMHAAEREWLVAYTADAENTPETDAALRKAAEAKRAANGNYVTALRTFDAVRGTD